MELNGIPARCNNPQRPRKEKENEVKRKQTQKEPTKRNEKK